MDGIAESVREEHARHLANSPPLGPLELARSPERVLPYMRYLHLERRRSDSGSGVSLWATPIRATKFTSRQFDVSGALLNADMDFRVLLRPPQLFPIKSAVLA